MATKAQAFKKAKSLGVEIEILPTNYSTGKSCAMFAPTGFTLDASDCHVVYLEWFSGKASEYWDALIAELDCGLSQCPDGEDCEHCNS